VPTNNPNLPTVSEMGWPPPHPAPTLQTVVWRLLAPFPTHRPLRRELARRLLATSNNPDIYAFIVAEIGARDGVDFASADLTRWLEMLGSRNGQGGGAR
jgi:hypothetical protein